ncbi:hypothetical protein HPB50_009924 [Hyalomma asiaticum]|uniref:Uncharacterized protein n=1 Tax=Hyalomma asiaticum TaxID=266040 RepID=A0ACB7RWF2_HYAAI|nr:hypothetical protein HPB50_009924 [Hyalomma asiaticum]
MKKNFIATSEKSCQSPTTLLNREATAISLTSTEAGQRFNRFWIQAYDTTNYMKSKVRMMLGRPGVRFNISWMLLNVHLTDATKRCLTGGPFQRLKEFREFHYKEPRMISG